MANALNKVNSGGIEDGSIVNADIKSDAAIAGSKLVAATTSVPGSMSAADKTKLDGVATSATANPSAPALTGSTNNTICTVTGANAIQGESTLTYDAGALGITGNSSGDGISITNNGDHYTSLNFDADRSAANNAIAIIEGKWNNTTVSSIRLETGDDTTNKDDGEIVLSTTPSGGSITERVRVDSSGRVLIGTTTEGYSPDAEQLTIASSTHGGITIRTSTTTQGSIYFSDGTSGAGEYKGQVAYNHNTDQLHLTAGGNAGIQVKSSGAVCKPNQPSFSVKGAGSWTSVSSGQWEVFQLANDAHNVGSIYDTTNHRFTASVAGVYQINCNMYSASADSNANTSEYCAFALYLNGSQLNQTWSIDHYYDHADQDNTRSGSWSIQMGVNDYIDFKFYASGRTWKYYGAHSSFSAHLLG